MQEESGFVEGGLTASPVISLPIPAFAFRAPERRQAYTAPIASSWTASWQKRALDIAVSSTALAVFALPMALIAVAVRLSSPGPAFFVQKRVGREGVLFSIFKFRSMRVSHGAGPGLTRSGDSRVTAVGGLLRKLKLDELPQLYNVLRGDMSLIGPRPKLPKYTEAHAMPFRPGVTGAATLKFRNEEELLSHVQAAQLDDFYDQFIRPAKTSIDLEYMARATFLSDLRVITSTFLACMTPAPHPTVALDEMSGADPGMSYQSMN
jgi:lipopolysaccharide/colanic/teichoic acid biosynthesis glycosyltransferase